MADARCEGSLIQAPTVLEAIWKRGRRALGLGLAILAMHVPVQAGDAVYRDPRQPSFTLEVPDGWAAERHNQGVTLQRDDSYFALRVRGGATSSGAMLVQLRPQFERQWQQLRELGAGATVFGGQPGAYMVLAGTPPSGIPSVIRIVTMTNGRLTYIAFAESQQAAEARRRPELDRIERSFAPESPR
jgi:hypothetical protein